MRIFLCITILLLSCCFSTSAQNRGRIYVDSILNELTKPHNDTAVTEMYTILASEYNDIDLDSSIYYGHLSSGLAQKIKSYELLCDSRICLGLTHLLNVENDSAMHYFNMAQKEYKKAKDTLGAAYALYWVAAVYEEKKDIAKALELNFKALEVFKKHNDAGLLATGYKAIGALYSEVEEYDKSKEYYKKALIETERLGDKMETGDMMTYLSDQFLVEEQADSALVYAKKALALFEEVENRFFIAVAHDILGEVYLLQKDYVKALQSFQHSGDIYATINDDRVIADNLTSIANVYLAAAKDSEYETTDKKLIPKSASKNFKLAIEHFDKSKSIYIDELDREPELGDVYYGLSVANEAIGKEENALRYLKRYIVLKDSFESENQGKQVAKLDAARAISLKDKELELQKLLIAKKRNERVFLIGGMVLLLVVLLIIFRNYRKLGISNKLLSEEKQKSEDLLHNILPEEIASELKDRGATTAQHFDKVTVLFTDFVDFTKAGEHMGSQALVEELHSCFKAFDDIMDKYGIEKIKTIGDAYLAVCGLPVSDEQHAYKVVSAAQEIRSFMLQRRKDMGDKTFEVRVGVHSGEVVAGIVGVKKFAYDIWGDTVNTAARMESKSESGKINISQTTYELVQDKFNCTYRGEIEAKGKGMLKMYFVEA